VSARLAEFFESIVTALEDSEIDYVVVGSVAAAAWGLVRSTVDIDLVVVIDAPKLATLVGGFDPAVLHYPVDMAAHAVRVGGSFNILNVVHGGKIDVFVPPQRDAFTRARITRRRRAEVLGVPAWVASPEDVVLAKLRWRLETRSEVQWRDCVEIGAINQLDRAYMRRWSEELGVVADLDALFRLVDETRPNG
jgi:hypothetical protein